MLKKQIVKGLYLGLTAGLLVTLWDSLFMLIPDTHVPYSYPLLLVTFNTIFWILLGGISGCISWTAIRTRGWTQRKENSHWFFFFLLPFALIYGVLGRSHIPFQLWTGIPSPPVFDYHLSFVWAALILVVLFYYLRKGGGEKEHPAAFFILEIATIILLFQLCSNLSYTHKLPKFYAKLRGFFHPVIATQGQFLIAVYIAGVVSIIGFYLLACFTIRPRLIKRESVTRHYFILLFLFLIVSGCVTGFFALAQKKQFRGEPAGFTPGQNRETAKIPHVILITLDTVRAESLSMYGPLGTSQNLEAFSREALVFENCIATSPWTTPSHASLFTGLYSTEHGCHGVLDQKRDSSGFPLLRPLSEEFVTLAEIFKENGYLTWAVVSNRISVSPEMKLHQGFQLLDNRWNIGIVYLKYPFRPILHFFCNLTNLYTKYTLYYRTADEITKKAISLLEKPVSPPVFLFMNYLDAHSPYNPSRPFDGFFLDTPFPQLQKLKQYFLRFIHSGDRKSWDAFQLSQYHGEIAYLDSTLGSFFSQLKQMGIYDSSLIIITSDHGELFGEHELYFHRGPIYEGVAKIPLVIKFPYSKRVGRIEKRITLVDLYPTILSICGLPIPDDISGKAFGDDSSPVVSELYEYKTGVHRTLYGRQYKYMKYKDKKDSELYDLYQDPMELDNLVKKRWQVTLSMEKEMQAWEKAHGPKYTSSPKKEETLSKKMLEELKALGYVQ